MSNRPHRRPRPKRLDPMLVELGQALAGCTCRADVRHKGVAWVELAHDGDCPARTAGRVVLNLERKDSP